MSLKTRKMRKECGLPFQSSGVGLFGKGGERNSKFHALNLNWGILGKRPGKLVATKAKGWAEGGDGAERGPSGEAGAAHRAPRPARVRRRGLPSHGAAGGSELAGDSAGAPGREAPGAQVGGPSRTEPPARGPAVGRPPRASPALGSPRPGWPPPAAGEGAGRAGILQPPG